MFRSLYFPLVALLLSGCAQTHPPMGASHALHDAWYQINYNGVGLLGFPVENVAVEGAGASMTESGLLEAWAQIRNRGEHESQLSFRTTFYDAEKVPLETGVWKTYFLPPFGVLRVAEMATHEGAAFFYFELREGR